jgi:hypothetical protein
VTIWLKDKEGWVNGFEPNEGMPEIPSLYILESLWNVSFISVIHQTTTKLHLLTMA